MPQCEKCGSEMNLIPAGVSKKTGKPYNAFYSCPNRCPKIRYQNQAQNAPTGQIGAKNEVITEDLKEYNNDKTDNMKELGAKRTAGEYANLLLQLGIITPEEWQKTFKDKADEIYNTRCVAF